MKVIMEFIPNHTSDQHKWFKESRTNNHNQYHDYYIWTDGKNFENGSHTAPNNWVMIYV